MKFTLIAVLVVLAFAGASAQFFGGYGLGFGYPYAYSHLAAPLHYAAPSGYVAATRGSLHTAPLPEGPHAFSHHINTDPAPGTW